jgi:hypothetical protein
MQALSEVGLGVHWNYTMEFAYSGLVVSVYVGEVETHDFCLEVFPKPHRKQQASSSFSTTISSTMSNQHKDSSLKPLSYLKKAFERLRSPKPRSANDSTGAARSISAPPIMRTPSSAIRAADAGMTVAGEIQPLCPSSQYRSSLNQHCRRPGWTPFT